MAEDGEDGRATVAASAVLGSAKVYCSTPRDTIRKFLWTGLPLSSQNKRSRRRWRWETVASKGQELEYPTEFNINLTQL